MASAPARDHDHADRAALFQRLFRLDHPDMASSESLLSWLDREMPRAMARL